MRPRLEKTPWKILLVEDDEDDYVLTRTFFADLKNRQPATLDWVVDRQNALKATREKSYDAILIDYDLGATDGLTLTREMIASGLHAPVIVLTGQGNYELDLEAMRAGAVDYLAKDEVTAPLLERTIRYAIEHKQIQESLLAANDQLAAAKEQLEERVQERTHELIQRTDVLLNEIHEREKIEKELTEVRWRLVDRTEAERLELSRELHDGPMQDLYGLIYELALLLDEVGTQKLRETILNFDKRLQDVIHTLRTIAGELRPPALAPFGLELAIRSHAKSTCEAHPEVELTLDLQPDRSSLPERVSLALFRIYQVAIANVFRHAGATRICIRLRLPANGVVLEIEDNGCGFEMPPSWYELALHGHLGLAGAAERAEAIGGSLEVNSTPGEGTLIRIRVPTEKLIIAG